MDDISFLSIGIEEVELSVRAYNILKRMGVSTFGELLNVTVEDANEWVIAQNEEYGRAIDRHTFDNIVNAQYLAANAWSQYLRRELIKRDTLIYDQG